MSHQYLDGQVVHHRHYPKKHHFTYKYFMVDMDPRNVDMLKEKFFSLNGFNLFSFWTKDHFGKSDSLLTNIETLCSQFSFPKPTKSRFLKLPRILNFVFNPISVVILYTKDEPTHLLVEVHNYNGGRVVYPVILKKEGKQYSGKSTKDMYVSPFFERDGEYEFTLMYEKEKVHLSIDLFEKGHHVLTTKLSMIVQEFSSQQTVRLFFKHTFLTMWVVTRTLWQTMKLKLKGLKWHSPIAQDQKRRY